MATMKNQWKFLFKSAILMPTGCSSAWCRALASGARGRWFKSSHPDKTYLVLYFKPTSDSSTPARRARRTSNLIRIAETFRSSPAGNRTFTAFLDDRPLRRAILVFVRLRITAIPRYWHHAGLPFGLLPLSFSPFSWSPCFAGLIIHFFQFNTVISQPVSPELIRMGHTP